ncbi:MAG: rhodanese-like domain-containing protein [Bacillota bacterium]
MIRLNQVVFFIVLILVVVAFAGCSNQGDGNSLGGDKMTDETGYIDITPEDAKERLDSGEEIILLDVRTKEEYDTAHIENSVLIPVDELETEAPKSLKDKDTPIFVYCRSGNRSVTAANILVELGYKNVYNLGGIIDWPYEVVE